ncbi:hypothetical protein [Burkholderia oklahomensis]|uniref:hypothetical protein n=1 Tax=Burkholderia oklahomensis TaxID=342113 RepID=UPI000AF3A62D|nr:hypothetical protein [Burkholderia oklahomensis]MBI0363051.1 hypothetical protein [Burkholderia oklahomensis]
MDIAHRARDMGQARRRAPSIAIRDPLWKKRRKSRTNYFSFRNEVAHESDSQEGERVWAGSEACATPPFGMVMYDESVRVKRQHCLAANLDNGQPGIARSGIDERAHFGLRYHYAHRLS